MSKYNPNFSSLVVKQINEYSELENVLVVLQSVIRRMKIENEIQKNKAPF